MRPKDGPLRVSVFGLPSVFGLRPSDITLRVSGLPERHVPRLAARGFGQLRHEFDFARVLVTSDEPLAVHLQRGLEFVGWAQFPAAAQQTL